MKRYIIAIEGETGSGEDRIAELLADSLDIPYYDRARLARASEIDRLEENVFRASEEARGFREMMFAARRSYRGEKLPQDSDDYIATAGLFHFQANVLSDIASKHNCVIRGRCANWTLKDTPYLMRVFVHAPLSVRVEQMLETQRAMSRTEIIDYVFREDKRREGMYMYYTGFSWRDAGRYDLSLDSGSLGIQGGADYIMKLLPYFSRDIL